jgi:hypothetical protein
MRRSCQQQAKDAVAAATDHMRGQFEGGPSRAKCETHNDAWESGKKGTLGPF